MARHSYDTTIFEDHRYQQLLINLGCIYKAHSACLEALRLAEDYRQNGGLIPLTRWSEINFSQELLGAGIAARSGGFVKIVGGRRGSH